MTIDQREKQGINQRKITILMRKMMNGGKKGKSRKN